MFWQGAATGSAQKNDNVRMINNMFAGKMALKQPDDILWVSQPNILDAHSGDIIAHNLVATVHDIAVTENQSYSFRSGNTVELNPGFDAVIGSDFVAEIVDIMECGEQYDGPTDFGSRSLNDTTINVIPLIEIHPNPCIDKLVITVQNSEIETHSMIVLNIIGEQCNLVSINKVSKERVVLDVSKLIAGCYFVKFTNHSTIKFIKH